MKSRKGRFIYCGPVTPCCGFVSVLVIKYRSEEQFKGWLWLTIPGHSPLWQAKILVHSREQKEMETFILICLLISVLLLWDSLHRE